MVVNELLLDVKIVSKQMFCGKLHSGHGGRINVDTESV